MSRSSSGVSEARRGAALPALPDPALIAIFSRFSMSQRLQCLAPVCKRWSKLCSSPTLVSSVALGKASGASALPRMRSLLLWLARHAAHVEELSLTFGDLSGDTTELLQLVAAAAAACGPRLRQLSIRLEGQQQPRLVLSSWLCGLTRLQSLEAIADAVQVSFSLANLTNLDTLALSGQSLIQCPPGIGLPPCLTFLRWRCGGASSLPEQATSLQQLQRLSLSLVQPGNLAGSLDVATRQAPSLTSLLMAGALDAVPAQLAALGGQLSKLHLFTTQEAVLDIGGIAGLTNLTALMLQAAYAVSPGPGLQQLTRLQRLLISNGPSTAAAPAVAPPALAAQPVLRSLPQGPWLSGLTHLALSYDVLFGSLDVLPSAIHLQSLSVMRLQCMPAAPPPGEPPPRWAALRAWLCVHPPLRRLTLVCWTYVRTELLDLMLALAERRPSLVVERRRTVDGF